MTHVTIPPVRAFARVKPDKAQARKPLEEAGEVQEAWGVWNTMKGRSSGSAAHYRRQIVDECCDVITATCNLLAALGVTDLTEAMAACEERNESRGRYRDEEREEKE